MLFVNAMPTHIFCVLVSAMSRYVLFNYGTSNIPISVDWRRHPVYEILKMFPRETPILRQHNPQVGSLPRLLPSLI
jgi:hypothetical protein